MGKKEKIKICVTGANGQLGKEFSAIEDYFPELSLRFFSKQELDIANRKQLYDFFEKHTFQAIVNCAAYTNVEKAEDEPDLANKINGDGPGFLAEIAKMQKALLVHFSTDYVFDGKTAVPYNENHQTNPINAYGKSKLLGENRVAEQASAYLIFRTSWLYSSFGSNFIKTMLKLGETKNEIAVVSDQIGSPTYARDLAFDVLVILEKILLEKRDYQSGIYHYCNEGQISWKDFASEIFKLEKLNCDVHPVLTKDYPTKAQRPLWSVLNTSKINTLLEIYPSDCLDALKECLKEINLKK